MQTSLFYMVLTVPDDAGYTRRKWEMQLFYDTLGWLLCLCPGELKFKFTSGRFLCPQCLDTVTKPSLRQDKVCITSALPPGWRPPFGQADGTAVCRSCPVCLCFLCHYSSWDEISESAKSSQASVWLTRMPSPPQRSVRTVATPQQRSLERAREPVVWLILDLSCCRNHLFCLRQPCCVGSVAKLQGSACLAESMQPPSAKLPGSNITASHFYRLRGRSSKLWS